MVMLRLMPGRAIHGAPLCPTHALSRPPLPANPSCRRPSLAVLDEVTSAVSEQAATQLYGQLHAEGITCLRCAGWHRYGDPTNQYELDWPVPTGTLVD